MIKSKLKIELYKDPKQKGIWYYSRYLAAIPEEKKLSLGEGHTPELLLEENLFLKREDQNPTGSLKDRGMAYLVSWAWAAGEKNLVLSSSGNAAISAANYCSLAGINLSVFVSSQTNKGKLEKLSQLGVKIFTFQRAVSEAIKYAQANSFFNLRPSQNEFGPEGYQTIAFELAENLGLIEDIFIPVSSGTALAGIAKGFSKLGFLPRIHLCQGAAFCPLASFYDSDYEKESQSLATALVAKYIPLKKLVRELVNQSGGSGWVISNQAVIEAQKKLAQEEIETSAEGALALAGFYKARSKGFNLGRTVVLLTGKKY